MRFWTWFATITICVSLSDLLLDRISIGSSAAGCMGTSFADGCITATAMRGFTATVIGSPPVFPVMFPVGTMKSSGSQESGPDSLQRRLQAKQSVRWEQVDLQKILTDGGFPGIPIWRDRRIDNRKGLDLAVDAQPIAVVLERVAADLNASMIVHEGWVLLCPKSESTYLPILIADARYQVSQLPPRWQAPLVAKAQREWPRLSTPDAIVQGWRTGALKDAEIQPLPYDLWDAGTMPAERLVDQLAIIAFGFNRRVVLGTKPDGTLTIEFPAWSVETNCVVAWEDPFLIKELKQLQPEWSTEFPALRWLPSGSEPGSESNNPVTRPQIAGSIGDLASLLDQLELRRPAATGQPIGVDRYSLRLDGQPAETVIRFIAQQTQREVIAEGTIGTRWEQPIRLNAVDMSLENLMREIGQQAGLEIRVGKTQFTVRPAPDEHPGP